jgi:hypothetical protein
MPAAGFSVAFPAAVVAAFDVVAVAPLAVEAEAIPAQADAFAESDAVVVPPEEAGRGGRGSSKGSLADKGIINTRLIRLDDDGMK